MQPRKIRVLVTDGSYKHTLAAVRSLSRSGFIVDVIGSPYCLCRWSRYVSKIAYPQDKFKDEFIGEFINFLAQSHYDVLLPIGARSVQLVSNHRTLIERYCALPLATFNSIELCLNKKEMYKFAAEIGINVLQTWLFTSIDDLLSHKSEISFPVVIKGQSEIIKDRVLYAHNEEQLLAMVAAWGRGLDQDKVKFPLIQQYIDGVGVGFFALYQHGQCKRIFMHQRLRETPPSGGASSCAISIYEPNLREAGMKILDALHWHGVAMVEFKRERTTGKLYLMEVNPKFWGSLDLALASGVDFPSLAVKLAIGEEIPCSEDYKVGVKFHWPLNGELDHVKLNPKSMFSVMKDCIDPYTKSNLSLFDPIPALYSMIISCAKFFFWLIEQSGLRKLLSRTMKDGLKIALIRTFSEAFGIPISSYSKINEQIYLGSQYSLIGKYKLKRLGISAVLNIRNEFDDKNHNLVIGDYYHIPVIEFTAPSLDQLYYGSRIIKNVIDAGGKIFIHCSEGVSRAPTILAAYFISQGLDVDSAVNLIKRSRPFINILPVQIKRLYEFASLYNSFFSIGGEKNIDITSETSSNI